MATKIQQSQAGLIAGAIVKLLLRFDYLNKCILDHGNYSYSHLTIDELYELEAVLNQAVRELL